MSLFRRKPKVDPLDLEYLRRRSNIKVVEVPILVKPTDSYWAVLFIFVLFSVILAAPMKIFFHINYFPQIIVLTLILKIFGLSRKESRVPFGHRGIITLFGRRIEKWRGAIMETTEGRFWTFPWLFSIEHRNTKQKLKSISCIKLSKPDENEERTTILLEFDFQYQVYYLFKNIDVEESVIDKGLDSAMKNAAETVIVNNTDKVITSMSNIKIADLIIAEFKRIKKVNSVMELEDWGVKVCLPITVNNCDYTKEVIASHNSIKIARLRAKTSAIDTEAVRSNMLRLKKGISYQIEVRDLNNKFIGYKSIKLDEEGEFDIPDVKIIDFLMIREGLPGVNKIIVQTDKPLDSITEAAILHRKIQ